MKLYTKKMRTGGERMQMILPEYVVKIINCLSDEGYEAYVVGGCVRDTFLQKQISDYDICTNALPLKAVEILEKNKIKTFETGIAHGTITAVLKGNTCEVTTYRVDGEYVDNRHPNKVEFVSNIENDLARRDFTINAMAYNYANGLVDCFNSAQDIKNKIIRCVGNSNRRFNEDALRILRALRFASTLGFTVDEKTKQSIFENKHLLLNISKERINTELCRLLMGENAKAVLLEFAEVFACILPQIKPMLGFCQHSKYHCYNVWEHTAHAIEAAPKNVKLRLAMLLHDVAKPACFSQDENGEGHFFNHANVGAEIANEVLHALKFDNETIFCVKTLVKYHDAQILPTGKCVKRWLNKIGEEKLKLLLELKKADSLAQSQWTRQERLELFEKLLTITNEVIAKNQCFNLKKLSINGNDLINNNLATGAQIGIILNELLKLVIDDELENDKNELLKKAAEISKTFNN